MLPRAIFFSFFWAFIVAFQASVVGAENECQPVKIKKIKVEGFLSKKFRKESKKIIKEFRES